LPKDFYGSGATFLGTLTAAHALVNDTLADRSDCCC
jgi:hypothetical protein